MYFFLLDLRVLDHGYREYWDHLVPEIRERGLLGERKEIASDQEAVQELTRIIKQKRFQTVVVVGGDALLACVASAAAGSGIALGYIPLGENCAFALRWGIGSQVGVVGDRLAARRLRDIDLLKIGRSFIVDHLRIGRALSIGTKSRSSGSIIDRLKNLFSRSGGQTGILTPAEFRVIVERDGLEAYLTSVGILIEINPFVPASAAPKAAFVLVSSAVSKKNVSWDQIRDQAISDLPQVTRLHLQDGTITFDRPVPVLLDGYRTELSGQVQLKIVTSQIKLIV